MTFGLNGWTPVAKKVGIWAGAITGAAAALTIITVSAGWIHAKVFIEPAAAAAQDSVVTAIKNAVEASERRLRHTYFVEGIVRDKLDSLILAKIGHLEEVTKDGVYSRREIDAMRAASYRRQDSLFRALRETRRR